MGQLTALIVDDEKAIRHVLSKQLGLLGYSCVAVANGKEALEKVAQQKFNLIMLDMRMPGMSGLDVLKGIRAGYPETCIVMLSALVEPALAAEALNMGADDYITKPCSLDYLAERLRKAHESRKIVREAPSAAAQKQVSLSKVTEDLMHQQLQLLERTTQRPPKAEK